MSQTILLVEDNPTDEKLTVRALKRSGGGAEIVVARDGAGALDYLFGSGAWAGRDTSALPAVVLLDLQLPRIDGLEVLRRVRADERTRFVPVVVLTSSREDEDRLRAYTFGTNAYVRKPLDYAQFSHSAAALGVFWLTMNEAAPPYRNGR